MNEGTGQTLTDSSTANNLPLGTSTAVEPTVDPTWAPGMIGNGLHFDQSICNISTFTDCHYVTSTTATMTFPSNQVSVEAWIKSTVNTTTMNGIIFWAGFINLDLEVNGTTIVFEIGDGSTWSTLSFTQLTPNVTDGLWHYLAGTYDGANLVVYVDGVQVATTPATTTLPAMNIFYIGGRPANVWWDGSIDEIRISKSARTPAEILLNYTPR